LENLALATPPFSNASLMALSKQKLQHCWCWVQALSHSHWRQRPSPPEYLGYCELRAISICFQNLFSQRHWCCSCFRSQRERLIYRDLGQILIHRIYPYTWWELRTNR
jgi:hypothetical protein